MAVPRLFLPALALPGSALPGVALPAFTLPALALPGSAIPGLALRPFSLPGLALPGLARRAFSPPALALPAFALAAAVAAATVAVPAAAADRTSGAATGWKLYDRSGFTVSRAEVAGGVMTVVGRAPRPRQRVQLDDPALSTRAGGQSDGRGFRFVTVSIPGDCTVRLKAGKRVTPPLAVSGCTPVAPIRPRGDWSATADYLDGDLVTRGGSTYRAIAASRGEDPLSGGRWTVFAARGAPGSVGPEGPAGPPGAGGPAGEAGPAGPQGPGFRFRGAHGNPPGGYQPGDVVTHEDALWIAVVDSPGEPVRFELLVPAGPAGPAGADGAPGPQGPAGADGAPGPQGPAGADGAPGPQGPAGADGVAGPQGPAGADGAPGPQGPAGVDGAAGPQGPAGADGAPGPQGPAGADGAPGPQGPAGADGAAGLQGPAGPTGASPFVSVHGLYGAPATVPASVAGGIWRLVAPAATVGVTPDQIVGGMIAAPAHGTGSPPVFAYALCWRPAGDAGATPMPLLPDGATPPELATYYGDYRGSHSAGGAAATGHDGAIDVGLCVRDYSVASGYGSIVLGAQTGWLTVSDP